MGHSPLANMRRDMPAGNRWNHRLSPISGVGLHHNAGVNSYGMGTATGAEVSAHYWITNEGDIIPQVDELLRAWTSGSPGYPAGTAADHRNITFEISNSPEGVRNGTWAISAAAQEAVEKLIGDIYKRHGLGPVQRGAGRGVGVHSDWVPTECPGPYIRGNLGTIIANAERYRRGQGGAPVPTPEPLFNEEDEDMGIRTIFRADPKYRDEWTISHPDIGTDLTGKQKRQIGNRRTVFRGFMVTTHAPTGKNWMRLYGPGAGRAHATLLRNDYIIAQDESRVLSTEMHR